MTGYIYCHKNKINGKVYIGQTKNLPEIRWGKNGSNYSGQTYFYREIIKYGWDNFDHIILEKIDAKSKALLTKKLNDLEIHYIREYESMVSSKGYNTIVKDNNSYIRLTIPAKRVINKLVEEGYSFTDAYNKYKSEKQNRTQGGR